MERDCERLAGELEASARTIQEVTGQRDELLRKQKQEANPPQLGEAVRAGDQVLKGQKEEDSNLRQLASARRDMRDLQVEMVGIQNQLSEAQKSLAEARKNASGSKKTDSDAHQRQADMLKQARDAASAQVTELKQRVGVLEDAVAEAGDERDAALRAMGKATQELGPEVTELRQSNDRIAQDREAACARVRELESELDELRASLLFTARTEAAERAELAKAFEETRALLMDAQRQNEALMKECEALHRQFPETMPVMESRLKEKDAASAQFVSEHHELLRQHEEQRLATIEISAQLGNAQGEIRELSASLAEARLLARGAGRSKASTEAAAPAPKESAGKGSGVAGGPIDEKTGKAGIAAMRRCVSDFNGSEPRDLRHIKELHTQAHAFSERARGYGQVVIHRITTAFAAYVESLFRVPERVTPEAQAKMEAAISFISGLLSQQGIERSVPLCDVRVYMVDDDPQSSETVSAALDCVGLKTRSTTYSSAAIADLVEEHYDLIVLDLDMPDLDGFELCSHIRKIPHHAKTPIIFLTGYESEGNREECLRSGGTDFFGKPFNVQELGLNVLSHIIQSRLNDA